MIQIGTYEQDYMHRIIYMGQNHMETFIWTESYTGPDLGIVRLHATVIPHGAPTAPYPNTKTYINDFIKI